MLDLYQELLSVLHTVGHIRMCSLKVLQVQNRPGFDASRFRCQIRKFSVAGLPLLYLLWSPYVIGQTIIFLPCDFYLSFFFFFSSPNLSGRRLDVYHTSTHGVVLVRI